MKIKILQLHNVSPEDFKKEILTGIEEKLNEFHKKLQDLKPAEYLTRKEVAKLFGVSLVTIHDWCKKGILKPYRTGNRVRFKRKDIEETLEKSLME